MKKQLTLQILLTLTLFSISMVALATPLVLPVLAGNSSTFGISLTISNTAPTITNVQAISDSPAEGTTKAISFYFNATDSNGVLDIPASNANITINQSGVSLADSGCIIVGTSGNTNMYECNVTVNYYNLPGAWTINASIYDGASATDTDLGSLLTMGTTYGITRSVATLTFNGAAGTNDVAASNNPQVITNQGNAAFGQLDVKAYEIDNGVDIIPATAFATATSATPAGNAMINNTDVTITTSSVAIQGTRNLHVYLDIPSGISDGSYASVADWVVTAS